MRLSMTTALAAPASSALATLRVAAQVPRSIRTTLPASAGYPRISDAIGAAAELVAPSGGVVMHRAADERRHARRGPIQPCGDSAGARWPGCLQGEDVLLSKAPGLSHGDGAVGDEGLPTMYGLSAALPAAATTMDP